MPLVASFPAKHAERARANGAARPGRTAREQHRGLKRQLKRELRREPRREGIGQLSESGDRGTGSGGAGDASKRDAVDRPGASGHRFGPDLACSECGILWDDHQRDPRPCATDDELDAFTRRPSPPLDKGAVTKNGVTNADPSKGGATN